MPGAWESLANAAAIVLIPAAPIVLWRVLRRLHPSPAFRPGTPRWKRIAGLVLAVAAYGGFVAAAWTMRGLHRAALEVAGLSSGLVAGLWLSRRVEWERLFRRLRWGHAHAVILVGLSVAVVSTLFIALAPPPATWPWYLDLASFGTISAVIAFFGQGAGLVQEAERRGDASGSRPSIE